MRDNFVVSRLSKVRRPLRIFALFALMATGGADAADLGTARQFFPPETSATIEQTQGTPAAAIVRGADGRILGYAFSTYEVSGSVGYAGRPLDIVAAITPEGIIAGAQIVAHEEPILVIGIPRDALAAYVAGFKGFDIRSSAGLKQTNDFEAFFRAHPQVRRVFFNGAKAEQCFRRQVLGKQVIPAGLMFARLPSTSPAHAGMSVERKLGEWRVILEENGGPAGT